MAIIGNLCYNKYQDIYRFMGVNMTDVKLENLADNLFKKISDDSKNNTDIFKTKIVIVPSIKTEAYLKSYFLKKYGNSVLMNVEFLTLRKATLKAFDIDLKLASSNEIRNIIIKIISENKYKIDYIDKYLIDDSSSDYYIKLFDISNELASLFDAYENDNDPEDLGLYGQIYDDLIKQLKKNDLTTLKSLYCDGSINRNKVNKSFVLYLFGFYKYNYIESKIIDELDIIEDRKYELKIEDNIDTKINIIKAPSKLREIEYIHSEICKLLGDKKNRFTDFLVIGTNMSEYEEAITRVFTQDNKNYPSIPYYINAVKTKNNNVYNALILLKDIVNKEFYTRTDFVNLINNNSVKYVRNITDNDINNWITTIDDINVYSGYEDWDYAKKRLLASKICGMDDSSRICINNSEYIPYSKIGLDDDSIVKFVKMVDDLNELIEAYKSSDKSSKAFIEAFNNALDKFLSIKDSNEIETNGYYKRIYETYNFWINNDIYNVPKKTYLETLIDVSRKGITNQGNLYLSGISFTDFDSNAILEAKYIFLLNASSNNLPLKKSKNALNKSKKITYTDELNAFYGMCKNCQELYVSYVFRDLKTDANYFLSNFVKGLTDNPSIKDIIEERKKVEGKTDDIFDEKYIPEISIDENGSIKDIYTNRGEKNRLFIEKLTGDSSVKTTLTSTLPVTRKPLIQKTATTSQLADFLKEPLSNKASRLFSKPDGLKDKLGNEFRPFDLDNLSSSNLFKEIVIKLLDNPLLDIKTIEELFDLRKVVPNITKALNDRILNDLEKSFKEFKEYIDNFGDAKICQLKDLDIDYKNGANILTWTLVNSNQFVRIESDDDKAIYYIPIKLEDKFSEADALKMIVIAIMDAASGNVDFNYKQIVCPVFRGEKNFERVLNITDIADALFRLNAIYERFIDYSSKENYFFDCDLLDDENYEDVEDDFYKLIEKVRESWKYFDNKSIFDYINSLGYEYKNYKKRISDNHDKQEKLHDIVKK